MEPPHSPGRRGPGDDLRQVDEQIDTILRDWGGSRDRRQPWKAVARFFDMLVTSARRQQASVHYVAGRLAEFWRKLDDRTIVVLPTELWVVGNQGLVAEGDIGRWITPAYLAGLRSITARPELVSEDLERLAAELAVLEEDVDRIATFRDWLWSAGPQGLDVELGPSALDGLDVVPLAEQEEAPSETATGSTIDAWNDIARAAAHDLDASTQARAYRAPVERYVQSVREGVLALAPEQIEALRDAASDAVAWPLYELDAVRGRPTLKDMVPPERLAARVVAQIESAPRVDRRLLGALTELGRSREKYAVALLGELSTEHVGAAIGDAVDLDDIDADTLGAFLEEGADVLARGLLDRVAKRAAGEDPAKVALLALLDRWKLSDFMRRVDVGKLEPSAAVAVAKALVGSETPLPLLRALLTRLPTRSAAMVWAHSPKLVASMRDQVRSLLHESPNHAALLVEKLVEAGESDLVAHALIDSEGSGWTDKMLDFAVTALVKGGRHDTALVELARARNAPVPLRLLVLDKLRERPAALAQAVKWRPAELLEPETIRDRLRDLRR